MKLSDFVATKEDAPAALKRPFHIVDTAGTRWVGACDEMALILVKAQLKLPKYEGEGAERMATWAAAEVTDPQGTTVEALSEWAGPVEGQERKGLVLGMQVDRDRLAKLLAPFSGELVVWDASKVVGIPCLGLVAKKGFVRALLASYDEPDEGVPSFELAPTGSELFELAMGLDAV